MSARFAGFNTSRFAAADVAPDRLGAARHCRLRQPSRAAINDAIEAGSFTFQPAALIRGAKSWDGGAMPGLAIASPKPLTSACGLAAIVSAARSLSTIWLTKDEFAPFSSRRRTR